MLHSFDADLKLKTVFKLIVLGWKSNDLRNNNQKFIKKEIEVGILVAKKCKYLV
jgi:hypothetical protein